MLLALAAASGVPAHVLVVDLAVVLVPLAALGTILVAAWRSFSRRAAVLVVLVAWAGLLGVVAATASGQRLAAQATSGHASEAAPLPWSAGAMALLLTAFWLVDRGVPGNRPRPWWLWLLGAAAVLAGVAAAALAVRAGYSGALAAWSRGAA